MEVKKSESPPSWVNLPRWAIDWDAANYEWTKQFKAEIVKLANVSHYDVEGAPVTLNIDGVQHLIQMSLWRPEFPKQDWRDVLTVCFMTKPSIKLPIPECCVKYRFYMTSGYSELANLLHMSTSSATPFDKDDCFQTPGMAYGDSAIRIVDQLNVSLGVKFCELTNAFHLNTAHLLRFRCTYYNKFGYYGQGRDPHLFKGKYSENVILSDIDAYNAKLEGWSTRDNPRDNTYEYANGMITKHTDAGYEYNIKPYGDNLVCFIPADISGPIITPARFKVYENPNGASSMIDRLSDFVGSLFISPSVTPAPLVQELHDLKACALCAFSNLASAKYCEYCTVELTQSQKECPACTTLNALDAKECAYCTCLF